MTILSTEPRSPSRAVVSVESGEQKVERLKQKLRTEFGDEIYDAFLQSLKFVGLHERNEGQILELSVLGITQRKWIASHEVEIMPLITEVFTSKVKRVFVRGTAAGSIQVTELGDRDIKFTPVKIERDFMEIEVEDGTGVTAIISTDDSGNLELDRDETRDWIDLQIDPNKFQIYLEKMREESLRNGSNQTGTIKLEYLYDTVRCLRKMAPQLGITYDDLISLKRNREIVMKRAIAISLIRKYFELSLPGIGRRFSNRDHTTVMHALKNLEGYMMKDPGIKKLYEETEKWFVKTFGFEQK